MDTCICGRKMEDRSTRCSRCVALHEIGLEIGAAEAEIKEAYCAHVKAWNPDRYADDKRQQRVAGLKLKKVNAAYNLLTSPEPVPQASAESVPQYKPQAPPEPGAERRQGTQAETAPPASPHSARENGSASSSASEAYSSRKQPIPRTEDEDRQAPLSPSTGSRGLKAPMIYAVLFMAIIAGTYFLNTRQLQSPILHHTGSAGSIPTVDGATGGILQQAQAPPAVPEFFSLGSSKNEVIAVQGPPTAGDDSAFHYGLSTVSFQNDLVVGWMVFPVNPLKVRLIPASKVDNSHSYFGVGSSKDEVIALEGTPTAVSASSYSYGKSSVTFQYDKVSTWIINPGNPLRVHP